MSQRGGVLPLEVELDLLMYSVIKICIADYAIRVIQRECQNYKNPYNPSKNEHKQPQTAPVGCSRTGISIPLWPLLFACAMIFMAINLFIVYCVSVLFRLNREPNETAKTVV